MSEEFKEWKVVWQVKPFIYNQKKTVFVKAKDEADAENLARDWIERNQGIDASEFSIVRSCQAVKLPEGEILT